MSSVMVSAPGKLMLFGEHAVLHGAGCIVTAVDQRIRAAASLLEEPIFELEAPDVQIVSYKKPLSEIGKGDIPKGARFAEIAVSLIKPRLVRLKGVGVKISTSSEFSSKFGFGSSSAVTVCVIKALSELFKIELTNKELFNIAYKAVIDVQKKGSGFDVAAAIYGGTLYFVTGGRVIESLSIASLPLVIGYSGVKADTVAIINQVSKKTKVFTEIAKIVTNAQEALEKKDWKRVGELMNKNQMLLENLGVSTKKLDDMIASAVDAGAYGAKLSGAGGGDCMIVLVDGSKREIIEKTLENAGGTIINAKTNAEGVRVEL